MEKKQGNVNVFLIILTIIIVILAIYFIFLNNNATINNTANNAANGIQNTVDNVTDTAKDVTNAAIDTVTDTVNIVDENAKALYDRVKKGITINGKLIEVPGSYMKRITTKITQEGYKMTAETKTTIDSKLDEIENIVKSEGKTDINDLSQDAQNRIKSIATDIENML